MELSIAQKITQYLLSEGEAVKKREISKLLNISQQELEEQIYEARILTLSLGLKLIENTESLELTLSSEVNELLHKQKISDLKTDLSEAALQTISVLLYKERATKAEIDFIRGVDSTRSLKNLSLRGIVEKQEEGNKKYYILTTNSLKYLGFEKVTDAPEFEEINQKIKSLLEN